VSIDETGSATSRLQLFPILVAAAIAIAGLALPAAGAAEETAAASPETEASAAAAPAAPTRGADLKQGACANRQTGLALPDSLIGTRMGDRLSSLGGADDLYGRAGHDCLFGAGGSDLLDGGTGGDMISAGSGSDRVAARDGRRDSIACGSGWDVVVADRIDAVRGCETVKLPPPDRASLATR